MLVGEVGEAFGFVGGRRKRLLAEHVHVAQAGLDGVRVFGARCQHEDRVKFWALSMSSTVR